MDSTTLRVSVINNRPAIHVPVSGESHQLMQSPIFQQSTNGFVASEKANGTGVDGDKPVNQDLFGGNSEAGAREFLGRFVEFRPGHSSI